MAARVKLASTARSVKRLNTGKEIAGDYNTSDSMKDEEFAAEERKVILKTLENILMIVKFDTRHEFNPSGVTKYIAALKSSQRCSR